MYDGAPNIAYRMLVKIAHLLKLIVDTFHKELPHNWPWEIMLERNQALMFDLNNRKQVIGLYTIYQFLPAYCMQTFEEIFVTRFFETGISIFGLNVANLTLRYVAYKDAKYKDLVHEDIRPLEESQKHVEACKATSYALGKETIF